jgi:hypothetical protein
LLARTLTEPGADVARLGDVDLETVLGDLADLVREAGQEHHARLEMGTMPTGGNA